MERNKLSRVAFFYLLIISRTAFADLLAQAERARKWI